MLTFCFNYLKNLYKNNKLLLLFIFLLLIRLITNTDNFLTIRDFDFYPNYINKLSFSFWKYYIYRPLIAFINYIFMKLAHANILILKHFLGKIYIILYIPIFLTLCSKFKLNNTQTSIALILFLVNPVIFATYDTLSPYFLIILFSNLQLIFLLESIEKNKSLLGYTIISILSLFCHWLMTINFLITLFIIFYKKNKIFRKKINYIYIIVIAIFAIIVSAGAIDWIFFKEASIKLNSYMCMFFPPYQNNFSFIKQTIYSLLYIIPLHTGIIFYKSYLFLFIINIIVFPIIIKNLQKTKNLELKIYTNLHLISFTSLVLVIQISNKLLLNSYHYNAPLYTISLIPFIIIGLISSSQKINKVIFYLFLIILILVNIYLGYSYRKESFDINSYITKNKILENNIDHLLVPSFVEKVMLSRYHLGKRINKDSNLFIIDDYRKIKSKNFVIDVIEYDELGYPMYDYRNYKKHIENYFSQNNFYIKKQSLHTFTRYFIKKNNYLINED